LLGENKPGNETCERYQKERFISYFITLPDYFFKLIRRFKKFFKKFDYKLESRIKINKEGVNFL
jgi:hypothetical protein